MREKHKFLALQASRFARARACVCVTLNVYTFNDRGG